MTEGSKKGENRETAPEQQAAGDGATSGGTGNSERGVQRAADLVRVTGAQRRPAWTPMRVIWSIATVVAVFVGVRLARHWFSHEATPPAVTAPSSDLKGVPDEAWNDPLAKLFDAVEARDAAACMREEAAVATVALSPRDRLRGQMLHARCEMLNGSCGVAVARMRIALAGVGNDVDAAVKNELATYCR